MNAQPDPEVLPTAKRRLFTARYKQSIVEQANRYSEPGEIEVLLRREGLYSSHLFRWRQLYKFGSLLKPDPPDTESRHVRKLEAENASLQQRLEQAKTIIDVQKELCTLLGLSTDAAH